MTDWARFAGIPRSSFYELMDRLRDKVWPAIREGYISLAKDGCAAAPGLLTYYVRKMMQEAGEGRRPRDLTKTEFDLLKLALEMKGAYSPRLNAVAAAFGKNADGSEFGAVAAVGGEEVSQLEEELARLMPGVWRTGDGGGELEKATGVRRLNVGNERVVDIPASPADVQAERERLRLRLAELDGLPPAGGQDQGGGDLASAGGGAGVGNA